MLRKEFIIKIEGNVQEIDRIRKAMGLPGLQEISKDQLDNISYEDLKTLDNAIKDVLQNISEVYFSELTKNIRIAEILLYGSVSSDTYELDQSRTEELYSDKKLELAQSICEMDPSSPHPITMALCYDFEYLIHLYHIHRRDKMLNLNDSVNERMHAIMNIICEKEVI